MGYLTKQQCIDILQHSNSEELDTNIIIDPNGRIYVVMYGSHDIALAALLADNDEDRYEAMKDYGMGFHRTDPKDFINNPKVRNYYMLHEYAAKEENYFITTSMLTSKQVFLYFPILGLNEKQLKSIKKLYNNKQISETMYHQISSYNPKYDHCMKIYEEKE